MANNPKHMENLKGKGFESRPENIHRGGRPKRGISLLNDKIKAKIGKIPKRSQIEDLILGMLDLQISELKEIIEDRESSAMAILIAEELLNDDKGFLALNTLLDRGIGKATQKVEVETKTIIHEDELED